MQTAELLIAVVGAGHSSPYCLYKALAGHRMQRDSSLFESTEGQELQLSLTLNKKVDMSGRCTSAWPLLEKQGKSAADKCRGARI